MNARPNLVSVPAHAKPPVDHRARLISLRSQLLRAAVRYVTDGNDGTRGDRLRTASNLSGIPVNMIEVEIKKL